MKHQLKSIAVAALVISLLVITVTGYVYHGKHRPAERAANQLTAAENSSADPKAQKIQPPLGAYRVVYLESNHDTSTIWSASPASPATNREILLALSHADGYPPKASLSPDGENLAYTLLSEGGSPAFSGSLWITSLSDRIPREIDENVDYGWSPKWSQDGTSFIYIKKVRLGSDTQYRNDVYVANLSGQIKLILSDPGSLEIVPVGWNADGNHIYLDRVEDSGDSLYEIESASGRARIISHLSHSAAWNLSVSPDGEKIVGSIQTAPERAEYAIVSVSIATGQSETIIGGASRTYNPIWNPNGKITTDIPAEDSRSAEVIAEVGDKQEKGKLSTARAVTDSEQSDRVRGTVPKSWSPDGQWLAVETYHQSSVDLALRKTGDGSSQVASSPWTEFIGWVKVR